MINIALIGGSGLYLPVMLKNIEESAIDTPYGQVIYAHGEINSKRAVFMARHSRDHSVPPHMVNYRANIWALKKLGVKAIIASTAVGSLNAKMKVGDIVVPDQVLDFTKNRIYTFFDGKDKRVAHIDLTEPYCPFLRKMLLRCALKDSFVCHGGGTYVCTEGPRFETGAEIKMYKILGGDIVGMTGVPELVLAREAQMCYAAFSLVTNMAAGISPSPLSHKEVFDCMEKSKAAIALYIESVLAALAEFDEDCSCRHALDDFGGFAP
ncbi:MAG: S-methyl-5'-thioadenosine phosphorylase [Acidaminococcales bacterium]|nr:S-methyl-5'-thioadenosine phosphorylase [Acidaminococcales bacterium]